MCGFFAIERSQLLEIAPAAGGSSLPSKRLFALIRHRECAEIAIELRDWVLGQSKMSLATAIRFFADGRNR